MNSRAMYEKKIIFLYCHGFGLWVKQNHNIMLVLSNRENLGYYKKRKQIKKLATNKRNKK